VSSKDPFPPRLPYTVPLPDGAKLSLGERPLIMAILNVTPDSFADSSSGVDPDEAVDRALMMEADGADMVDVGGESTRPGARPVSITDELARLLPVVRVASRRLKVPLSVDTYKAEVARAAIDAGAVIVNDISGLRFDPALATVTAERGAALVLMHTRGRPATMYAEAAYEDLIAEITAELAASVAIAVAAGVPPERLILDPGVGFAKRPSHSYGVLARLPDLASALGRPLLVGPSRKSFMRQALNERSALERDWGTAAAVTAAILGGAHIVRVHAAREMAQVARVAEEIRRAGAAPEAC
jgi:dihydropteroate synthase